MPRSITHILLLAALALKAVAKTALQQSCETEPHSYYFQNACFIGSVDEYLYWEIPNPACPSYPNGHLAFVTSASLLNKLHVNINSGNLLFGNYWTALRQVEFGDEPMGGWAWVMQSGEMFMVPKGDMILWATSANEPNDNGAFIGAISGNGGFFDAGNGTNTNNRLYALCQYDEPKYRQYKKLATDVKGHPHTLIKEVSAEHTVACAFKCNEYLVCGSFSFSLLDGSCLLHWLDGETQGYTPGEAQGYEFWVVD